MEIILDTNALIYATKNKIDLSLELKGHLLKVPNLILDELENLSKNASKGLEKDSAKLTLALVKHYNFDILTLKQGHPDTKMLEYAKENNAAVLTNDLKFKRKLKKAGITIYSIRQNRLVVKNE